MGRLALCFSLLCGLAWGQEVINPGGGTTSGTVTSVTGTAPVASTGGTTPAVSLQNSASANVTSSLGTDTKIFTASGSAATNGDVITGDAQGGLQDSGVSLGLPANGLIAYYKMTEGSGSTLNDSSGSGNNATFGTGTPTWITRGGLQFNGANDVNLPAALNAAQTFIFATYQPTFYQQTGGAYPALVMGSSGTAQCAGILIFGNATPNGNWDGMENWNGAFTTPSNVPVIGSEILVDVFSNTVSSGNPDIIYRNGYPSDLIFAINNQGGTLLQTSGFYQMGGNASGCEANNNWLPSGFQILLAAFYNRALSSGEAQSATAFLQNVLQSRGEAMPYYGSYCNPTLITCPTFPITGAGNQNVSLTQGTPTDVLMLDGDSEMNFLSAPSSTLFLNNANASVFNNGVGSVYIEERLAVGPTDVDPFLPAIGKGLLVIWAGTNDYHPTVSPQTYVTAEESLATYCKARRQQGWKVIVATMLDRFGTGPPTGSSWHDSYNALIRADYQNYSDGLLDFAANANVGADGQNTNTTYFTDGLHTTTAAKNNILDWELQRAVNRMWGNRDFSTATVYTTGAAAATAITAASESTNTVTITSTLNPGAGTCVAITGVTPSGYNTNYSASGTPPCWYVLTSSSTNFTYYNTVSGLGVGTVFGTVSVPLQADADNYVRLAGSATSPSFTLESCQGRTGQIDYFKNENTTSPWVLKPTNSETIDGATSITMPAASTGNYPTIALQVLLTSASTGNCTWERVQ